jgi:hypothetical protein
LPPPLDRRDEVVVELRMIESRHFTLTGVKVTLLAANTAAPAPAFPRHVLVVQ